MQTTINPADEQDSRPKKERLKSLDTFRGWDINQLIISIQQSPRVFGTLDLKGAWLCLFSKITFQIIVL